MRNLFIILALVGVVTSVRWFFNEVEKEKGRPKIIESGTIILTFRPTSKPQFQKLYKMAKRQPLNVAIDSLVKEPNVWTNITVVE